MTLSGKTKSADDVIDFISSMISSDESKFTLSLET